MKNGKLFQSVYNSDLKRYRGGVDYFIKKFLYFFRKTQFEKFRLLRLYYRLRFKMLKQKRGIEIPSDAKIGKGLYLGHAYNITIKSNAVIGENCNIHKGVTIGQENRGRRKGAPIIGNQVWIGINATIVGKVKIGDDVLIAPNSYVNCDVPDHTVVIGNPCILHHRDNATEGYINNLS